MNTQIFKKAVILLFLTLMFHFPLQATIINSTSGSISVNQSQYLNNMYEEWEIVSGQNFSLLISYEVDIEYSWDNLYIYALDIYDNPQLIKMLSGSDTGICSTELQTGKALIIFETDGSVCGGSGYQGFTLNFVLENQQNDSHTINRLYVNENSFVNGNSSVIGNVNIGTLNGGNKSVNIYNNQKNQYGLYSYTNKSGSSSTYGILTYATNSLGNVYGLYSSVTGVIGKKWAGYFNGGDVAITGGNTGIGVNDPKGILQVRGTYDNSWIYFSSNAGLSSTKYKPKVNYGLAFTWNYSGSEGESIINYSSESGSAPRLDFTSYNGTDLTTEMTLRNGSLGIGITQIPDSFKLAVGGKIIAEEVVVKLQSAWPDYVFKPEYRLMPLHQVEQFVRTNKHLPGIPPAAQVEEKGLSMGEMQNKLLQKVEELTLYIIEQDKKIRYLEEKLK